MRSHILIVILAATALGTLPSPARAQSPAAAPGDSIFEYAARMVREGRGGEGRAIVDSLLAAAPAGSPEFTEALYWQSALAASAADAERGYRRLVVEFPAARRTGDAMFNLAQLELARGDRAAALRQLERMEMEQPSGSLRVRAALLAARLHADARDTVKACASLAAARAAAPPEMVELRNRLEFQLSSCPAAGASQPVAGPSEAPAPTPVTPAAPVAPARGEGPAIPVTKAEAPAAAPPASGGRYTVQLAAFDTRAEAERFAARVARAGHAARVTGTSAPFRVRVGRWATHAEAARQLPALRALSRDAFVTSAEADTR